MDFFSNIGLGFSVALSLTNIFYCFLGALLGTLVGVIPGLGVLAAISMLFPLTFHLEPTTALIMLAGIWYGTTYGGSTASILLNLPGTPANAVTCLDGYPMAKQGRGGVALFMTTVASFFGASFGIILLTLFTPVIAEYALQFGSAEYFALMLMGLVAASTISEGSAIKGLAMVVLGIIIGLVGMDTQSATIRYSFGILGLLEGVSLIALAMGVFGVAEIIMSVRRVKTADIDPESLKLKAIKPSRDEVRRSWFPMLRGASMGSFFGTLPGTGPSIAAFLSYAIEKRISRTPERFGKGAIEGIMAPEAANNAADQTAFIPTLSLGVPGSATMALMLGVLMIHGVAPGPNLISSQPELFWGLIMSFWVGNLILLLLNIPLIGVWVRMLTIPYHILFPAVLAFICIGAFTSGFSPLNVWMVFAFGVLGYLMRVFRFPGAPLLLGFVLGPLMEEHFRRAMVLSRGDFMTFFERPISATIMALTGLVLIWGVVSAERSRKRQLLSEGEVDHTPEATDRPT
ncbi:tripartite tricarboxylate transporter permease [Mameliella sp. CS4]|uniref:tripartite tricarboxylate transporter permease n=1 Tax=Mameliella sp. CS4 TaxID=2862329 RepID=UPI001C60478A|nr:tripartite tricarboxylate transporter permease [Mameliella sp. CS4]MBW4984436.1 tripartite tricarboxylate transporter permease [Mameliella sp. CS4]